MSDPVVIIGAGPAGLSCATELAKAGREIVIIDDNPIAGGQYFRQLPAGYHAAPDARLLRDKVRYDELAETLKMPGVLHLASTVVWGMPEAGMIAYAGPAGSGRVRASSIVIASGAQEKSFPFPGWTLPGIISAGGCLNLAKAHGLVPTGRMVVAGNGPLVLVAAATMIAAAAEIDTIVEAQSDTRLLPAAAQGLLAAPKILRTGIGYRARILKSGARFRTKWMIAEAHGTEKLEAVAIAPIGEDGRPLREKERWIKADVLVLGYGLLPGSETARVLGCKMELRRDLNGVVPKRDTQMRTSIEDIYAIGDGAGIGGVEIALMEGRIAAHAILRKPAPSALASGYKRLDAYRRTLNLAYATSNPLVAATDETIICRCEEITLGRLAKDPNSARDSLNALKVSSRIGMGRCQGRNCLHIASSLLGFNAEADATHPRTRPPLRPVRLADLAADANAGPAREPDEINASKT